MVTIRRPEDKGNETEWSLHVNVGWTMGLISKMRLWGGLKGVLSPFALEPNWFPAQMLGANSMCEVSFHMD